MFDIDPADESYLLRRLKGAEAVLILGAGASATSTNASGGKVKQSQALAGAIAEHAGMTHNGETLATVLGAVLGPYISQDKLNSILATEYLRTTSGADLEDVFNYTWQRVYTWNIDDSLENLRSQGVQRRHHFNAMSDKVANYEDLNLLHVVHLHGQITKPDHGYILTEDEYARQLALGSHEWYRQLAQDYVRNLPIFVGSTLAEPILSTELTRARRERDNGLGRAFLIVPDELTQIERGNLASRNIIHLKGTLSDFIAWLSSKLSKRLTPRDALKAATSFAATLAQNPNIDLRDLETARPIYKLEWSAIQADAESLSPADKALAGRRFLEGAPPSWRVAASDIPVWLSATTQLYEQVVEAIRRRDRLFVATGQSGSGKTMALMQSLLRYVRENPEAILYELRGEVMSLRATLNLIQRLHPDDHVLVFLGDAFLYGDSLAEDVTSTLSGRITIFSSARSGEWRQHIERRVGEWSSTFPYQRFMEADFQPLIERLTEFVPAPRFKKLSADEKVERFARSKEQLLIALREATESKKFSRVIADEYANLPNHESKLLLLISGIATLPRVGISAAVAREAYDNLRLNLSFDEALRPLDGIMLVNASGRYVARHELYVRHIIENAADLSDVIDVVVAILKTFTKFKTPIAKNVGRFDATLFKFLLNHNFIFELASRRGEEAEALKVFQSFEVDFQLDGHFWLQYGQCLVELGRLEEALTVLHKSIQAYSDNSFAWHSLADVQLRVAAARPEYDTYTKELIADAVKILTEQDQSPELQTDKYATVTLAHAHIGALVKHDQQDQAKRMAKKYFERIQDLERRDSDSSLASARDRLMKYLVHGEWFQAAPGRRERNRKPSSGSRRVRTY